MADAIRVTAAYDTDWHLFLTCPAQGPLGFCTGVGTDEDFDQEAATRTLAEHGWTVVGGWLEEPPEAEEPYSALVVRITT